MKTEKFIRLLALFGLFLVSGQLSSRIPMILIFAEQNPYASPRPVVEKVLIVCPVSLVNVKQFTIPVPPAGQLTSRFRIGKQNSINGLVEIVLG